MGFFFRCKINFQENHLNTNLNFCFILKFWFSNFFYGNMRSCIILDKMGTCQGNAFSLQGNKRENTYHDHKKNALSYWKKRFIWQRKFNDVMRQITARLSKLKYAKVHVYWNYMKYSYEMRNCISLRKIEACTINVATNKVHKALIISIHSPINERVLESIISLLYLYFVYAGFLPLYDQLLFNNHKKDKILLPKTHICEQ